MPFYTDKQAETWLEREARNLPMPDGSTRPLTTFGLVWETADSLVKDSGYALRELIAGALEEEYLQGLSFEEAFTCVVGWLDDRRRKGAGV